MCNNLILSRISCFDIEVKAEIKVKAKAKAKVEVKAEIKAKAKVEVKEHFIVLLSSLTSVSVSLPISILFLQQLHQNSECASYKTSTRYGFYYCFTDVISFGFCAGLLFFTTVYCCCCCSCISTYSISK